MNLVPCLGLGPLPCQLSLGRSEDEGAWLEPPPLGERGIAKCLPVCLKEEGVTCGLPPDGCVDAVIGDVCTIAGQWLWVARLQIGFSEKPVAVTCMGSSGLCEDGPGLGIEMTEAMLC